MNHTHNQNNNAWAKFKSSSKFQERSKIEKIKIALANEIYEKRMQMGWTQQDLADRIGSTQKVVSRVESGDVNFGIDLLGRLITGLCITSDRLVAVFDTPSQFYLSSKSSSDLTVTNTSNTNLCEVEIKSNSFNA